MEKGSFLPSVGNVARLSLTTFAPSAVVYSLDQMQPRLQSKRRREAMAVVDALLVVSLIVVVCFWLSRLNFKRKSHKDEHAPIRTWNINDADVVAVTRVATSSGAVGGLNQGDALRMSRQLQSERLNQESRGGDCGER